MFLFKRNGYYHLEYFDESENRIKRISTKSTTKPEALKFLTDFKCEYIDRPKVKFTTLKQFQKDYLTSIENIRTFSYKNSVKFSFDKLIAFLKEDYPLSKITNRDIENYINSHFQVSKYATALVYRTLKSAFTKAVAWNYLSDNPFQKVKLPILPKPIPSFINENELRIILTNETNNNLKDIYQFAFHTGMRLNEILNLMWSSIDFNNKEITIRNTESFTTKNKKERVIPMNQTIINLLQKRIPLYKRVDKDLLIFEKIKDVKYSPFFVSKRFKKAVIKSGLDSKLHFHSLRHSFCSNLVMRGCPINVIKELAGHSQISVTMGYTHVLKENLQQAVNLLD
ncbi:MAG: site-specific integrase [Ignavibacteriaceae bacterium]